MSEEKVVSMKQENKEEVKPQHQVLVNYTDGGDLSVDTTITTDVNTSLAMLANALAYTGIQSGTDPKTLGAFVVNAAEQILKNSEEDDD